MQHALSSALRPLPAPRPQSLRIRPSCSDDFSCEGRNVLRLMDYAATRGCEITGDYICEVVIDFPVLDMDRRQMFYKSQIPVKF